MDKHFYVEYSGVESIFRMQQNASFAAISGFFSYNICAFIEQ